MSVLCPELYNRLVERFGSVRVANEGEMLLARSYTDPFSGKHRQDVIVPGEYYVVSCNKCDDTRYRLWINHRWADFRWQVICYNKGCYQSVEAREQLWLYVMKTRRPVHLQVSEGIRRDPRDQGPIELPGPVTLVDQLPGNHQASLYLLERGFDLSELAQKYQVSYCDEPDTQYPLAKNRIIIPLMRDGVLVGWQARFIGERHWPTCSMPKYYGAPGMKKSEILYNFDRAREQQLLVLVEGVTDVWRVGSMAAAMFGKSLSFKQRQKLVFPSSNRIVVMLLDGDARSESERITNELRRCFNMGVIHAPLPVGTDPAVAARKEIGELILASAIEQRIDLPEQVRSTIATEFR